MCGKGLNSFLVTATLQVRIARMRTGPGIALGLLVHSIGRLIIELLMLAGKILVGGSAYFLFTKEVQNIVLTLSKINFVVDVGLWERSVFSSSA